MKTIEEKIKTIKNHWKCQGEDGIWDFSPYSVGRYNSLELVVAILEDRKPILKDMPENYGVLISKEIK